MKDFGRYKRGGVNLGVGTDTYPHNMLDEMRLVAYLARTQAGHPRTMSTTDVFDAATIGGARALGPRRHRPAAPGCRADIVLVDATHPRMQPRHDPMRSLIYAAGDRAVKDVYVDGQKVVGDGRVPDHGLRLPPPRICTRRRPASPAAQRAGLGAPARGQDRAAHLQVAVTPLLQVEGLRTVFRGSGGDVPAVDGVSLDVARGRTLGIVGESGCGKSVLSLSIMRLVAHPGRIAAGRVLLEGQDLAALSWPRCAGCAAATSA
jgi:ABC-type multidrug transport system fused ATPase/permease subunit